MKNPIFKNEVNDLFEKLAVWPFDAGQVARQVAPDHLAKEIARGQSIGAAGQGFVEGLPGIATRVIHGAGKVLAPASEAVAKPFYSALGGMRDWAGAHPGASRLAVGGALALPILAAATMATQKSYGDRLMNLREDPSRDVREITASLEVFLEKRAGDPISSLPSRYMHMGEAGKTLQFGFIGGLGGALAGHALTGLGGVISDGIGSLKNLLIGDRQRKQLFDQLIMTDVLLRDQIQSKPESIEFLRDAYATMCRFAPSLSTDTNAVRSFLREVVVGGGGVNYLTIKDLIQTEKALHHGGKD